MIHPKDWKRHTGGERVRRVLAGKQPRSDLWSQCQKLLEYYSIDMLEAVRSNGIEAITNLQKQAKKTAFVFQMNKLHTALNDATISDAHRQVIMEQLIAAYTGELLSSDILTNKDKLTEFINDKHSDSDDPIQKFLDSFQPGLEKDHPLKIYKKPHMHRRPHTYDYMEQAVNDIVEEMKENLHALQHASENTRADELKRLYRAADPKAYLAKRQQQYMQDTHIQAGRKEDLLLLLGIIGNLIETHLECLHASGVGRG